MRCGDIASLDLLASVQSHITTETKGRKDREKLNVGDQTAGEINGLTIIWIPGDSICRQGNIPVEGCLQHRFRACEARTTEKSPAHSNTHPDYDERITLESYEPRFENLT